MKKSRKILYTVLPVLMLVAVMFVTFAPAVLADGVSPAFPAQGTTISKVETLSKDVWATVVLIARILAFAAIIFAGIRYMFASAEQKADIKKGLIYLVIGAVLVFASTFIVDIVVNITNSLK